MVIFFIILFHVRFGDSSENGIYYARPGGTIELSCPLSKKANENIQWMFKNGDVWDTVADNSDIINPIINYHDIKIVQYISNGTINLKISNITSLHEGKYQCIITKGTILKTYNASIYLKQAPKDLIVPDSAIDGIINCTEYESLTLSCYSCGGKPKGKVYWISNPDVMTTNDTKYDWSNITFNVTRNLNKFNFTCTVEHDMLLVPLKKSVILNVFYKPVVYVSKSPSGDILEGQDVKLLCSSTSNPEIADVLWSKDDTILTMNSTHTLDKVTKNNTGLYVCQVTNSIGDGRNQLALIIKETAIVNTETVDEEEESVSSIVIYLVICCCLAVLMATTAGFYSCWKSGKPRMCIAITVKTHQRRPVQEIEMHMAAVEHYTEIDF